MLHISIAIHDNKQLLDEVEHDIMNYQCRGLELNMITQLLPQRLGNHVNFTCYRILTVRS